MLFLRQFLKNNVSEKFLLVLNFNDELITGCNLTVST